MTGGHEASTGHQAPQVVALILTHAPPPPLAGPPVGSRLPLDEAMVGWVMSRDSVDAAVPEDVQRILAATLCHTGLVTFLDSTVDLAPGAPWRTVTGGSARLIAPTRLQALLRRPAFPLRCTRDPELVRKLFRDPTFSWLQGGQFALVSHLEEAPLELDYPLVDAAFNSNRVEEIFGAIKDPLLVWMRPGPDGDFAHFVVRREAAPRVWERLTKSCAEMSIPLKILDGPAFGQVRWITQED
ncbi:hypothetical protein [Hyalangium versicolor]|uniref:hypothetical protein n=1 Tax=Hyalangium versicolor TaxID=2861190 RepID=UPI001CCE9914|nr:hypothetical protein [Hyalangium versicolor]